MDKPISDLSVSLLPWPIFFLTGEGTEPGKELVPDHITSDITQTELSEPVRRTHCTAQLNRQSHSGLLAGQLWLCLMSVVTSPWLVCEGRRLDSEQQQRQMQSKIKLHFNEVSQHFFFFFWQGGEGVRGKEMTYHYLSLWVWNWFQWFTWYCFALWNLYLASHLGILLPFSFKTDKEGISVHERIISFISSLKDIFLPFPETLNVCIDLLSYLQVSGRL